MSNESRTVATLKADLQRLGGDVAALKEMRKSAFSPAPPMPQGQAPADPAMMQQQQMAPPMDPSMMAGGAAPPMDPSMMAGGAAPPMDPNAAAMGGGQAQAPVVDPAMIDNMLGLLEEMGAQMQQYQQAMQELKTTVEGELQDLAEQVAGLEKRLVETEAKGATQEGLAVTSPAGDPQQAQAPAGGNGVW